VDEFVLSMNAQRSGGTGRPEDFRGCDHAMTFEDARKISPRRHGRH